MRGEFTSPPQYVGQELLQILMQESDVELGPSRLDRATPRCISSYSESSANISAAFGLCLRPPGFTAGTDIETGGGASAVGVTFWA